MRISINPNDGRMQERTRRRAVVKIPMTREIPAVRRLRQKTEPGTGQILGPTLGRKSNVHNLQGIRPPSPDAEAVVLTTTILPISPAMTTRQLEEALRCMAPPMGEGTLGTTGRTTWVSIHLGTALPTNTLRPGPMIAVIRTIRTRIILHRIPMRQNIIATLTVPHTVDPAPPYTRHSQVTTMLRRHHHHRVRGCLNTLPGSHLVLAAATVMTRFLMDHSVPAPGLIMVNVRHLHGINP